MSAQTVRGLQLRLAALALIASVAAVLVIDHYKQEHTFSDTLVANVSVTSNTAKEWSLVPNPAIRKAKRFWPTHRCAAPPVLSYVRLPYRHVAEAHWSYLSPSPTVYLGCRIVFTLRSLPFRVYCAAMIHEYGHLSGFYEKGGPDGGTHSRNPSNVMYPSLTARNVPRTCSQPR